MDARRADREGVLRKWIVGAVSLLLVAALPVSALPIEPQKSSRFRTLHTFERGQGSAVEGRVTYDSKDNFLFAAPTAFGRGRVGTLVRLEPNGKRFQVLHQFDPKVGGPPVGQVVVHPNKRLLLGVTREGGDNGAGLIFSVKPDGSDFRVLKSFDGRSGREPRGAPVLSENGKLLFGTTSTGGEHGGGTVWRIGSDGEGFVVLHHFGRTVTDPATPLGGLARSKKGKTLFGTTLDGGRKGLGTIYSIWTDGTRFSVLHEFSGGKRDGASPETADLTVSYKGGQIYGTTPAGGARDLGIAYRIRPDGTGFLVLHSFGASSGSVPKGGIAQGFDGLTLYGTTSLGGEHKAGVLYQLRANGTRYKVLHDFAPKSGAAPLGGPIVSANGRRLYGATSSGGAKDAGSIYAYDLFD
jgi:uncharacterized repeat protein (TIGR03803 family)